MRAPDGLGKRSRERPPDAQRPGAFLLVLCGASLFVLVAAQQYREQFGVLRADHRFELAHHPSVRRPTAPAAGQTGDVAGPSSFAVRVPLWPGNTVTAIPVSRLNWGSLLNLRRKTVNCGANPISY